MNINPPIPIPPNRLTLYWKLRVLLWIGLLITLFFLSSTFLFPNFLYIFDFSTPNSSKNNLLNPRLADNTPRPNGKFDRSMTLTLNAGVLGNFSNALLTANLEKKSAIPTSIAGTLRRSYQAFWFPKGEPLDVFPSETLYKIENEYYALRDGTLVPFVGEAAFLSRYPEHFATIESRDFLSRYPVSKNFIGFRTGSLLSFADGVFVVTSETTVRPVGSAEIFLAFGYHFADVLPVNSEDVGIYERGRILLLGAIHPDGTLFHDRDTNTTYLIDQGTKRPLTDPTYRDFLMKKQTPIEVSQSDSEQTVSCVLTSVFLPRKFTCDIPLEILAHITGSDFELTLSQPDTEVNIRTLGLEFRTEKSFSNALTLLATVKNRILTRFDYAP